MTSPPTSPLDHALAYAARGWHVFPIITGTKRPATTNGLLDATIIPERITRWWTLNPDHNIAVATGPASGIWVLDVDVSEDEDKHGDLTIANLETEFGALPDTCTQLTPRGGQHLIWAWDDTCLVRNDQSGRVGADLDVRGDGGYIVVAPSVHPNGSTYVFDVGMPDDPADAPPWLLDLVRWQPPTPAPTAPGERRSDRPGDIWAAATDWAEILTADGWTYSHAGRNGERHWVRPGKALRDGTSATTGYTDNDNLKVFTSSMVGQGLDCDGVYSKIGYLAATRHGGDHAAAASALAADGHRAPDVDMDLSGLLQGNGDAVAPHDGGATNDAPWPELLPLQPRPTLPPWPVHVLPQWMADHITETADQLQVPIDLCAQFALGAVAAAAMGYSRVVVGGRWREPLNLYLATALPSGGGKSPAEKAMTAPIRQWEARQREASMSAVSESRVRRKILERKAKDAEESAGRGSIDIGDAIAAGQLLADHVPLHPFRRLADDATPEKLTQILADQKGLMAVLSTEAELLDMAAGTYGAQPNIAVYLKAYSGDPIMVDRKGGSTNPGTELRIEQPLLTVGLAMQPTVIDFIGERNAQLKGRGFLARFLFSCPTPTTGARDRSRVLDAPSTAAADTYSDRLNDLADRWMWPASDMTLTADAERRFIASLQAQEAEMHGRLAPVSEWVAKLQSATLRVVGLLHLVDGNAVGQPITVDTLERAIIAGDYWIDHALAMAADPVDGAARQQAVTILDFARRKRLTEAKPRDVQVPLRESGFRSVEDIVPGMQHLAACGYVRLIEGAWSDVGVRGISVRFMFRPLSVTDTTESDHTGRENARNARNGKGDGFSNSLSLSPHPHTPPSVPRVPRVLPEPVDNSPQVDPTHGGLF